MKKFIAISMIIAGTFTSAGMASAADITIGSYSGWSQGAFSNGER